MRLTSQERILYGQAVWATFRARAGTLREMSSAEFVQIGRWVDAQVPLAVVLQAIEDFEGTPRRLEAIVPAVEREHRRVIGAAYL